MRKMEKLINELKCENYNEEYQFSTSKQFKNSFDKYLREIKDVKYLILGENPLKWGTYVYNKDGNGGYVKYISEAFGIKLGEERLKGWSSKGILFLDIYQLFNDLSDSGFDLNTKHKNNVSYREILMKAKINYGGEELNYPVFRMKIAILFLEEILKKDTIKVDPNLKIALMMPQLTSLPIFNYFSNSKNEISLRGVDFSNSLRQLNCNSSYSGALENIIIPRHKANTIGGSNNPKLELIKLALDL